MNRALQLASLGLGSVSPNPMVGCVIVHDDIIIGEGFHQKYGEAHAEVNAINSVRHQELLPNTIAYVTLEPCAHHGKTPPCANLLVSKKIKKVVIATTDPFDKVDGKGIQILQSAGIEVTVGVLEEQAQELNRRFFTFHEKKRPYVILKWAQTSDGFIARENYDSKWISNAYSRQLTHKWRTEEDGILVGKNTAIHDNPALTARDWMGPNPTRILLDSNLVVPNTSTIFHEDTKTLIINVLKNEKKETNNWIKVDAINPRTVLSNLYREQIQSVIIEGGSQVLNSFIQENCWDEARIFTSHSSFGKGIKSPPIEGTVKSTESVVDDELTILHNPHG